MGWFVCKIIPLSTSCEPMDGCAANSYGKMFKKAFKKSQRSRIRTRQWQFGTSPLVPSLEF
jgi:hypothetical protein